MLMSRSSDRVILVVRSVLCVFKELVLVVFLREFWCVECVSF